jgi:hypothetical protein
MRKIYYGFVVSFMLLAGCTTISLQGHWVYHDTVGQVADIDITDISKNEVYLKANKNLLSGVYQKSGDLLVMSKPDNPRATGFKLKIVDNNELIVIEEPPTSLTGQKHISGQLRRE